MSDIDIAMAIDASGAQDGANALNSIFDAITAGAARAMSAMDGVSQSLSQMAGSVSQSLSATNQYATSQTASYDKLSTSITALNANLARLVASNDGVSQSQARTSNAFENEAQKRLQLNQMIANMVIMRQDEGAAIDSINQKTGALASTLGGTAKQTAWMQASVTDLNNALKDGAISQTASNDAVKNAAGVNENAAKAANTHAAGLAGISRELIVIGREAISGDFSRLPGSLLVLTNRMGGLSLGTLGVVAGFGALAAAMAYPVLHAADLDQQFRSVTAQIEATGNAANVTAQDILNLSNSISPSSSFSRKDITGTATQIASDNVIAPNLGIDQLKQLTDAALSFAQVTGQQAAPAAKTLTAALDGGTTTIAELNRQYPIFTAAELENLQAMERHGQYAQALGIEVQKLDDYFHGLAQDGLSQSAKSLNELGAAWTSLMDQIAKSGPIQTALHDLTDLANVIAAIGGSSSASGALDKSALDKINTKIGVAMDQAGQGGITGFAGGQMLDSLVQQKIDLMARIGATALPSGSADLNSLLPSWQTGNVTVSGGTNGQGASNVAAGISAAQSVAMAQAKQDAQTLADAYQQVGLAQTLAIAKARDYAGALTQEQKAQADTKWAADQITIMAQYGSAVAAVNRGIQQQIEDTAALAAAWNQSTQAGLVAEATQKALAALRQTNPGASAEDVSSVEVQKQLEISYNTLNAQAAQQLQTLLQQRDASQAIADVAGDKELTAYAKITEQVIASYQKQLDTASALTDQTAQTQAISDVQDKIAATIQAQWDIHENGIQAALQQELVLSQQQLDAAQADLQMDSRKLDISKEEQAVQAEIVKLKQQGIDVSSADAQQILANVRATQQAKDEAQAITDEYKQQQQEVRQLGDNISRDMAQGLELVFQSGGNGWDQMIKGWHRSIDSFLAEIIAQMAETQIVLPIIESVTGVSASGSAGHGQGAGGAVGSLFSAASTGSSISGALGGPSIGSALGITGEGGLLTGAGSYLFGTAGASVGASTVGAGTIGTLTLADGTAVPIVSSGAEIGAISGGETAGVLGSGGVAANLAPVSGGLAAAGGGFLAGNLVGGAIGSPGGGAVAGAASGAATGALIGTFILPGIGTLGGAVIGGAAGLIGGILGGQHPTVGPDSDAYSTFTNGTLSIGGSGADNGGSVAASTDLLNSSMTALNSTVAQLGVTVGSLGNIEVGTFKGNYYVKQPGVGGGPGVGDSQTFKNEADAVQAYVMEALKSASLTGLNDNGQAALKNSKATTLSDLTADINFGQQFDASINAMKTGVTDFSQAAEVAAETTSSQLVASIEQFKQKAADLGLSAQAAADGTKAMVENFLGLSQVQPPSQLEQNVETIYGKLEGVSGLLAEVGISQADATAKVKDQVEQMLGITQAAPAMGTYATELASIKQTFADLAPILDKLGISSQQAAAGLTSAEQQITQAANDNIQSQIDSLTGGIGTSLNTLITNFKATFADLAAVGGDMSSAQQLMALDIANLYKPETQAAIQDVTTAYNNQITVEQNLAQTAQKTSQDIGNFLSTLGSSNLSNGSPLDQLNSAKQAFDQAIHNAQSSDPTIAANAQGQLTSLAQTYLTASRAYNASGSGYTSDYTYVQQQLQLAEKSASDQAAAANSQITLLQQQLSAATGTQNNTLTIAQAVQKLNDVMSTVASAINSGISAAGGGSASLQIQPSSTSSTGVNVTKGGIGVTVGSGGFSLSDPTQVSQGIAAITTDYQTLLGRTQSASESSFYLNQLASGMSLDQIQKEFLNSPEYLAAHSHANGGIASGWSMVGERGPEPVFFGQPAKVFSHESFRDAIGSTSNDNGTAAAIQTLRADMAALRQVMAEGFSQTVNSLGRANSFLSDSARAAQRGTR